MCSAFYIHSIAPRGDPTVGTTALIPEFGGLVATGDTALLNPPLPERVKKIEVTEKGIKFNDRITLPYEPFIGTLGVSPEIEAVTSLQPDYWGGNMDLPDVGPGSSHLFPRTPRPRPTLPWRLPCDQGDGELCGVAVEIHRDDSPGRPDQELADRMAAARERQVHHDDRLAGRWKMRRASPTVSSYGGWSATTAGTQLQAYFLLTQAGRVRLGNMVDPKYTLGASILKAYL